MWYWQGKCCNINVPRKSITSTSSTTIVTPWPLCGWPPGVRRQSVVTSTSWAEKRKCIFDWRLGYKMNRKLGFKHASSANAALRVKEKMSEGKSWLWRLLSTARITKLKAAKRKHRWERREGTTKQDGGQATIQRAAGLGSAWRKK